MLPRPPDLQSAWLLLLYCASPRFNYTARTLPPSLADNYSKEHDKGMWETLVSLLGREDLKNSSDAALTALATLPLRMGGCGLRSATRTNAAAYWASWADTLAMMQGRCPALTEVFCRELETENSAARSLREATAAQNTLQAEGFTECPT